MYNKTTKILYSERITIMKTVAKVFIIIGMILQCFLIFPLVLGIIALKKLKAA